MGGCRRVAKSTGASVVTTLADMDGKESFDASSLGQADEVTVTHKRSATTHFVCVAGVTLHDGNMAAHGALPSRRLYAMAHDSGGCCAWLAATAMPYAMMTQSITM